MADGKKGFILYADNQELFKELNDEQAGKLIKHILAYVNDEDPETDDQIVKISFIPIKQQLKRDLKNWELIKESRSKAGKASAEARRKKKLTEVNKGKQTSTKSTSVNKGQQSSTNPTVSVNENVNVTVNDNERVINIRRAFIENVIKQAKELNYDKSIYEPFCEYWTETDFESRLMQFQTKENFGIKSRLKRWKELGAVKEKNGHQEFKFPEAWKIKQFSTTEYQDFKKQARANGWIIKQIQTTGQTSFEKDGKQVIL